MTFGNGIGMYEWTFSHFQLIDLILVFKRHFQQYFSYIMAIAIFIYKSCHYY